MNLTSNVSPSFVKACTLVKDIILVDFLSNGYKMSHGAVWFSKLCVVAQKVMVQVLSLAFKYRSLAFKYRSLKILLTCFQV